MELNEAIVAAAKALSAGLCMGIGSIGPAIGEGNAVGKVYLSVMAPKSETNTSNPNFCARTAAPQPLSPAPNITILFSISPFYLTFNVISVIAAIMIVTIQKRTVTFASCIGLLGPLNTYLHSLSSFSSPIV